MSFRNWLVFVFCACALFIGNFLAANWNATRGREIVVEADKSLYEMKRLQQEWSRRQEQIFALLNEISVNTNKLVDLHEQEGR